MLISYKASVVVLIVYMKEKRESERERTCGVQVETLSV